MHAQHRRGAFFSCVAVASVVLAGCSEPAADASSGPPSGKQVVPAAAPSSASPSPATPTPKPTRDPRAGTSAQVKSVVPKVTTNSLIRMSAKDQQAAARWLTNFIRRSELDLDVLPEKKTPELWRSDMTAAVHADFAADVRAGEGTWGNVWGPQVRHFVRAESVTNFSMKAIRQYVDPAEDRPVVVFDVVWDADVLLFAGAPNNDTDRRLRQHNEVSIGVLKTRSGGWLFNYWQFRTSGDWLSTE